MSLLAIETTGPLAGVAVTDAGGVIACLAFRHRMDLAKHLLPRVEAALAMAGVALPELEGIAVSLGPGSYTGIRIGVVTAKALAYAAGIPLSGVPTLEALAAAADAAAPGRSAERLICALVPARADECYAGLYQHADGGLRTRAAATVMRLEALAERLARYPGSVLLAGDASAASERLAAALGPRLLVPTAPGPLAPWVATLGRRRLAEGGDDPVTLAPIYVRAPAVTLANGRVAEA